MGNAASFPIYKVLLSVQCIILAQICPGLQFDLILSVTTHPRSGLLMTVSSSRTPPALSFWFELLEGVNNIRWYKVSSIVVI